VLKSWEEPVEVEDILQEVVEDVRLLIWVKKRRKMRNTLGTLLRFGMHKENL